MRDNGRDKDMLKFMVGEGKTTREIYDHFHDIMNPTLYSMLKRFKRDGLIETLADGNTKGGNGQPLLRYITLKVPLNQMPKVQGFHTKRWGRLPSRHSLEMSL